MLIKSLCIIDFAISDVTSGSVVTSDESEKKLMNESLVVLYNGLILDTTQMGEVPLQYIDSKKDESDKYVITYYSYENYSFKESKLGIFSSQLFDGLVKMDSVGKIAISEDYNAIPRQYIETDNVPNKIKQRLPIIIDDTKMETIDLDGDGKEEK